MRDSGGAAALRRRGRRGRLTRNAPLLVEVAHELRLREEDVVELVHAELEDFIDVQPPVQVFMEGLHFTWGREGEGECDYFTSSLISDVFQSSTFVVGFRRVAELRGEVFVVIEVQRGGGHGPAGPAVVAALLFHHQGHCQQLSVREEVGKLLRRQLKLWKRGVFSCWLRKR